MTLISPHIRRLAILVSMAAVSACISGSSETKLNVNGKYKFITEPVKLSCKEKTTGLAFSMSPLPSQTFTVDVSGQNGEILLHSIDFNWNMINLRMGDFAATQSGTDMTGTVDGDGVFYAETTDTWINNGAAGPVQIRQRFEGKFTEAGVGGTYSVYLFLQNYNVECDGSAGFEGEKLT